MEVKVFFNSNHRHLEESVNSWLGEQIRPIEIIHVLQSSSQAGHCISVWYRQK